jgi:NTE family protein
MREMRAISFVTRLIDEHEGLSDRLRRMMVHSIAADDVMGKLGVASKLNADWEFMTWLKDTGRERADTWLAQNFSRLGQESTIDIRDRYL